MFYVAGNPVKLFQDGVTEADRLALVPITNRRARSSSTSGSRFRAGYLPVAAGRMSPRVAVKAVLVSYDFRNTDCDSVGRFAQILYENLGWLRQNGHPKWKSVDLDVRSRAGSSTTACADTL